MKTYIVQRQHVTWARGVWADVKLVRATSKAKAVAMFDYLSDDNKLRAVTLEDTIIEHHTQMFLEPVRGQFLNTSPDEWQE